MALSDKELIINANKGDVLALEELIYRYDKMVLRLAMNTPAILMMLKIFIRKFLFACIKSLQQVFSFKVSFQHGYSGLLQMFVSHF